MQVLGLGRRQKKDIIQGTRFSKADRGEEEKYTNPQASQQSKHITCNLRNTQTCISKGQTSYNLQVQT